MAEPTSITELVNRHRGGDGDAASEIFAHYAQRLSQLAEQHLSRRLAGRVEAEDVVQSAFRTFFSCSARGEFLIDSRAELWQLLVKITLQKARMQGRRQTAAVRDVSREQHDPNQEWLLAAVDHEPGPEDAVMLVDQIEVLLRGLPPLASQVLERRLQGQSVTEIARELGLARQAVYRTLALLQQRLARS